MAPGEDRISQLPTDILDHILGFLPIQEAAKTGVLSPIWRDVWSRLTQLNFDYHFYGHVSNKNRHASKYVRKSAAVLYVINKVLVQHNGNIRKFVLNLPDVGKCTIRSRSYDFDQWLLLVTKKGVKEIYIRFSNNIYRLPNCIFSCLTLKRLHLYGVIVEPMNFPCILPNVVSLRFECVGFGPINLRDRAIDVPVLEKLSFLWCQNMFHFDITTPKLCSLTIKSCTSDVLGKFLPDNLDLRSSSTLHLEGSLQEFVKEFSTMRSRLNLEYLKLSGFYRESDVTTSALVQLL